MKFQLPEVPTVQLMSTAYTEIQDATPSKFAIFSHEQPMITLFHYVSHKFLQRSALIEPVDTI